MVAATNPGFATLQAALGYQFRDESLLAQAMTHRSAGSRNNERLEFLGDALLNFVVAQALFEQFPAEDEGRMSRMRASLVKKDTLAAVGRDLELGRMLVLGSGELKSGGHRRSSILADAVEATIGAVLLDGGVEAGTRLIRALWQTRLDRVDPDAELKDPKTRLQEYLQRRGRALPVYQVVSETGADHNKQFTVECVVGDVAAVGVATASSRRKAEQAAAEQVLESMESAP